MVSQRQSSKENLTPIGFPSDNRRRVSFVLAMFITGKGWVIKLRKEFVAVSCSEE